MERDEIEKIVADLMLGGMDTTAITSQWIIYALASNPVVQVRTGSITYQREFEYLEKLHLYFIPVQFEYKNF